MVHMSVFSFHVENKKCDNSFFSQVHVLNYRHCQIEKLENKILTIGCFGFIVVVSSDSYSHTPLLIPYR